MKLRLISVACSVLFISLATIPSASAIDETSPGYQEALRTAAAMDALVRATRAYYTSLVVNKLKKEGTGGAIDSGDKAGFVPLPAQFVRKIIYQLVYDKRASGDNVTSINLRSQWNLNDIQGLTTEFEKEGWEYLQRQQAEHMASGGSMKKIDWQPYVKIDTVGGQPVIRYVSADPASSSGCVACHNSYEQRADVQRRRRQDNIEAGKTFSQYELMGALAITIPIK